MVPLVFITEEKQITNYYDTNVVNELSTSTDRLRLLTITTYHDLFSLPKVSHLYKHIHTRAHTYTFVCLNGQPLYKLFQAHCRQDTARDVYNELAIIK